MDYYSARSMLQLVLLVLMVLSGTAMTSLQCPKCGKISVPYPLSTSPSCGDHLYKVRCTEGTLWFDSISGSSYMIASISPENQQLIIRPPGFLQNTCATPDFRSGGILLNDTLPFRISDSNMILKLNCSNVTLSPLDCSSNNPCYSYIKGNGEAAKGCANTPYCCSYTTGGSKTAYRVVGSNDTCTAYQSFVNLNVSMPVGKWPEPGLEIGWESPKEPVCELESKCSVLVNSTCLRVSGKSTEKRCLCNSGFEWDPHDAICSRKQCNGQRHCRHHINKKQLYTGLTFATTGIFLVILSITIVIQHQKHMKRVAHRKLVKQREEILNTNNHGKAAKLFCGREIKKATNNFTKDNLLGIGGFGEVFKGVLDDGTLIAVKRAKAGSTLGMDQVLNEVCVLCQVNHRSLVRLLGCCVELEEPVLIYEYVANGTLFDHLHGRYSNKWGTLTFQRRLLIAQQTADGLAYLHFSAFPPIYHRDIKSSNILLDGKLDVKVSDFGLSRLIDTEATHISTCAQGTLGYLDPEYYQNFQLTDRSDVYSFGVVLLELLTSKKAIDFNRDEEEVNLAVYVTKFANEVRLLDVVDDGLKKNASKFDIEAMKALGFLAVACVDEQRKNRPSMREVADELDYIGSIISRDQSKELSLL